MAKIKPRARLIRTIGDKLISGPEAAIIELVKNAYDADSNKVQIEIIPPCDDFNGVIVISDFGHGMDYNNIINEWLEPATDTKAKNKKSRSGLRKVLGAKGVGRFATASLGRFLAISSVAKVENGYETSKLNLDWEVFEGTKYLEDIDIDITSEISKNPIQTGVKIEIKQLNTIWDKKKVSKLIRELRRLSSPNIDHGGFEIYLNLDGFTVNNEIPFNFDGQGILHEQNKVMEFLHGGGVDLTKKNLIKPYSLNDESDYHLKGFFNENGDFSGEFKIVRGDNILQDFTLEAPALSFGELNCGTFSIDFKVYDLEKESIERLFYRIGASFSNIGLREARSLISQTTGVAIYRAGFRIRPYGEPDNDWLHLENRRVQNPSRRIGHGQISGAIYVGDETETSLVERSSREGLENNGAFERLVNLITNVLQKLEQRRFDFRTKAGISRKPEKKIDKAREIASFSSIVKAIQELTLEEQKPILLQLEKESQALTKTLDEIEAYQRLLESRAALGMVVAQVIHDGRTYLEPINSSAKSIQENAKFLLEDSPKGDVVRKYYPKHGQAIRDGAKGLSSLFKSLDPISGRMRGRPGNFKAREIIDNSINLLEEEFIVNNINVIIEVDFSIKIYGYAGDFQSSLLNILKNASHWLSISNELEREIVISERCADGFCDFIVMNNGPLIDEKDVDNIFDAGFTLKSNGHGLGLVIAREACRHSNGDLFFAESQPETTFVIRFPISQEEN